MEARELVSSGDYAVARARLQTVAGTDQANRSEEYTTLHRRAMEGLLQWEWQEGRASFSTSSGPTRMALVYLRSVAYHPNQSYASASP